MPRRPSAFEVSYPGEEQVEGMEEVPPPQIPLFGPMSARRKRLREDALDRDLATPAEKAVASQRLPKFVPPRDITIEIEELVLNGEDEDIIRDGKVVRRLDSFCFFDPQLENMYCVPDKFEYMGKYSCECAGAVPHPYENDEDEGQEDGIEETQPQKLQLKKVIGYSINYCKFDDPFYIETDFSWYILQHPSPEYTPLYKPFYVQRKIVQAILSTVVSKPNLTFEEFKHSFSRMYDNVFPGAYTFGNLEKSPSELKRVLEEYEENNFDLYESLCASPVVQKLRDGNFKASTEDHRRDEHPRGGHFPLDNMLPLYGNADDLVLKKENQSTIAVTPLIGSISANHVPDSLNFIASRSAEKIIRSREQTPEKRSFLHQMFKIAHRPRKIRVPYREKSRFLRYVTLDDKEIYAGAMVMLAIGSLDGKHTPELPPKPDTKSTISDYIWFGQLVYINGVEMTGHIRWFYHGSQTVLQEVADYHELYLSDSCDDVNLSAILCQASVDYVPADLQPPTDMQEDQFFCRFRYDETTCAFTHASNPDLPIADAAPAREACPCCHIKKERFTQSTAQVTRQELSYGGYKYHIDDFIFVQTLEEGPCRIGQITEFTTTREGKGVFVRILGRIVNLEGLPETHLRDEKHLFLTDEEQVVPADLIIRPCFVVPCDSLGDLEDSWTSFSCDHFYVVYTIPAVDKMFSWTNKRRLLDGDLTVCKDCFEVRLEEMKERRRFREVKKPLRALDIYAGLGAFGRAMEEDSVVQVTHMCEISPSAAKTAKKNSPGSVIWNQDTNRVLDWLVHWDKDSSTTKPPKQIYDGQTDLESPIKQGDIDVLLAGFPCQAHSDLNQFKDKRDMKSYMYLNALSFVDHLRPSYVVFENVPGFFKHDTPLNGRNGGTMRMGGLKVILRCLQEMDYQVRWGKLQAGHYGTPQTRVRFFLFAAKRNHSLPEMPQPTHDFPALDKLEVEVPIGHRLRMIRTTRGTAPLPLVTIEDALSDMPHWDLENPWTVSLPETKRIETQERKRQGIPAMRVIQRTAYTTADMNYRFPPRTSFQCQARAAHKQNSPKQNFVRNFNDKVTNRIISIPIQPNADYRSLRSHQMEYQTGNAVSAAGRAGYRAGMYGRPDKDKWFNTVVTNMTPTAKQSRVINPWCNRTNTVREFARLQGFPDHFEITALSDRVVTMTRQIGNAVAWPMGRALGRELENVEFERWRKEQQ